jgi:hypothetical protein
MQGSKNELLQPLVSEHGILMSTRYRMCSEKTGKQPIAAVDRCGAQRQIGPCGNADSEVGKLLIKAGTALAAEEMEKDPDEAMQAVINSLGFNPFEQEAQLTATVFDPTGNFFASGSVGRCPIVCERRTARL